MNEYLTPTEQGYLLTVASVLVVIGLAVLVYFWLLARRIEAPVTQMIAAMTPGERALYTETYLVNEGDLFAFRRDALQDGWRIVSSAPVLGGGTYQVTIGAMVTPEDAWELHIGGDFWPNRVA